MPKMKTKSAVKKRFRMTANGKVKAGAAYKRHRLRNRSQKMKRTERGTFVLDDSNAPAIKRHMPYG